MGVASQVSIQDVSPDLQNDSDGLWAMADEEAVVVLTAPD